jgi:hypothetical protein
MQTVVTISLSCSLSLTHTHTHTTQGESIGQGTGVQYSVLHMRIVTTRCFYIMCLTARYHQTFTAYR